MRKTRRNLLFVASIILLVMATAMFWVGCSQNATGPDQNADLAKLLPGNAAAIAHAISVQDAHTAELLQISGVVGTGTSLDDNGNPVIRVFTNGTLPAGKISTKIEDVPVAFEETGAFTAMALTGTYRPVPIGVSVGNDNECASGTIGCVVVKGGQRYILSNNHVLARQNAAAIGEKIDQPGRYDKRCGASGQVATLSDFQRITFGGSSNTMDAAIAAYTAGTANTCATPAAYYGLPGSTIVSPSLNLAIKKVGRTTSLTTATISSINVTVNVGYTGGTATFTGQFMTTKGFTKSGDSGSLVVTNNSSNSPVGLLFAGTTQGNAVCNPIGPVLSRFAVTICSQ